MVHSATLADQARELRGVRLVGSSVVLPDLALELDADLTERAFGLGRFHAVSLLDNRQPRFFDLRDQLRLTTCLACHYPRVLVWTAEAGTSTS